MEYGEWASLFQRSFPGGRFKEYEYIGGNVTNFKGLKVGLSAPVIESATVVFNQNGQTLVMGDNPDDIQWFTPLTDAEYAAWKEEQHDAL